MSSQPNSKSHPETPQHARPSMRPDERPSLKPGPWQRLFGFFSRPPKTASWMPAVSAEHSVPTLEPLARAFSSQEEDVSIFDDEEDYSQDFARIAANNLGTVILFSTVDAAFHGRPFDVPFYTARKGRALITVIFSEKTLPGETTLERVVSGDHPMALNLSAFVERESPMLRANLMFPDKLRTPLMLETLLNLYDEDVQEFLSAVESSDELDLLFRHESNLDATIDLSVSVSRLGALVHNQVAALGTGWSRDLPATELATSRQAIARVYRTSEHAMGEVGGVKLRRVGRAKCLLR